ncbi:hypothetical protein [Spirosoma sordidisoli]|uniref:Uncharacterized protein n=1 Tax=Spirosoma sordidisoli TaxID=2502893 RepID=A0A4Q2UVC1_9BACT|nr:hypothetical protein [Spirosoma sordidisoli]RYC70879.1 hypothetical protein EQG79_01625 [Spirosoma sordidisoli]
MKFLDCNAITGPLTALTASNCMVMLQQVRRFGFQLLQPGTALGTDTTILAQGTHTAAMALTTDAKLLVPKFKVYSPELPSTEAVKIGSNDNSTPAGRSIVVGQTVPVFNGMYTGLTPTQYDEVETLFARANANADFDTLGFYAYLGDRQFMCSKTFGPIPAHSFFIGDPTGGQLHSLTQFPINFELEKGWYRDVMVVTLNFNHNLL